MAPSPKFSLAKEIIADLRSRDIRVWMEQDQVAIDPADLLSDEDREQIRSWKGDIVYELDRERIALQNTGARRLERRFEAEAQVLGARVSETPTGWDLTVDYDEKRAHVDVVMLYLPRLFFRAVEHVYENTPGRVKVSEIAWFLGDRMYVPNYSVTAEGLDLEDVLAELRRLEEQEDADAARFDDE